MTSSTLAPCSNSRSIRPNSWLMGGSVLSSIRRMDWTRFSPARMPFESVTRPSINCSLSRSRRRRWSTKMATRGTHQPMAAPAANMMMVPS